MQAVERAINQGKRIFVFLGEAGSGKSELAVNWALSLAKLKKTPRFFDMDQTKPLFRSRTVATLLRKHQIDIDDYNQILDAPNLTNAVLDRLCEAERYSVLDIGGNERGAKCIGQYAQAWQESCAAFLVVNCYRPFSDRRYKLQQVLEEVSAAARIGEIKIISNPNFGEQTTIQDVVTGHRYLASILPDGCKIEMLAAPTMLAPAIISEFPAMEVMGINRYITTPWEAKNNVDTEGRHAAN